MRLTDLNDFDISLRLEELSRKHNIKLTFAHKRIYISLLRFCEEKGQYDENNKGYYVNLAVNEMTDEFKAGHTTVINALKLLSGCGAVSRVKSSSVKNGVPHSGKSQVCITYINVDFLSCDKI